MRKFKRAVLKNMLTKMGYKKVNRIIGKAWADDKGQKVVNQFNKQLKQGRFN